MVTSQLTHAAAQPLRCDRDPCDILALRGPSFLRSSPANSFIVPQILSTTWSAKTVLPTDSHVVAPSVRGFNFPATLAVGTFETPLCLLVRHILLYRVRTPV